MYSSIVFSYKTFQLEFDVSSYTIENQIDVDYDSECSYSSRYDDDDEEQCDHDYNRCQVLTNITIGRFDVGSYIENQMSKYSKEELQSKLIECDIKEDDFFYKLTESFSVNFHEYLDAYGESDYYGETLVKKLTHYESCLDCIEQNLIDAGFKILLKKQ